MDSIIEKIDLYGPEIEISKIETITVEDKNGEAPSKPVPKKTAPKIIEENKHAERANIHKISTEPFEEEKIPKRNTFVADETEELEAQIISTKPARRRKSIIRNDPNAKTYEEIKNEEKKLAKEEIAKTQKLEQQYSNDGFQMVKKKSKAKVKQKAKFNNIQYIGLKLSDEDNPFYALDDFIKEGLEKLSAKFTHENLSVDFYNDFQSYGWRRPPPPYHVTSLFIKDKKDFEKDEFMSFKENIKECIMVKGLVVVENFLMVLFLFPQSVIVENLIPHMTLLLKDGKAFDSNAVLDQLIIKNKNKLSSDVIKTYYKCKLN